MIMVFGATGSINDVEVFLQNLQKFAVEHHSVIQALDARVVYGKDHLLSAVQHAQRAFRQGMQATNTLALETLLYAAGERQIHKAIHKMGIKPGTQHLAFVLIDTSGQLSTAQQTALKKQLLSVLHLSADDKVLEGDSDTLKRFGLTEQEMQTVPAERYGDLVLEKVAMVDIIK